MKYKILPLITLLILVVTAATFGQTKKQYLKAANNAFEQKNYYAAMKYYGEVLDFDSTQTQSWYNLGLSAKEFNAFTLAEQSFKQVLKMPDGANFPQALLHLGEVQKRMGKYEDAISSFEKVMVDSIVLANAVQKEKATKALNDCEWAVEVTSNPNEKIYIENLGDQINSPASEIAPQKVGNKLFYSSLRFDDPNDKNNPPRKYNKVMVSEKGMMGEEWEGFNASKGHTAHSAFSINGYTRVYYTLCDYINEADIRCQIYYREKDTQTDTWKEAVKLPETVNKMGYTSTQPEVALVGEEHWLLFSSDKPGGKGGMDIYKVIIDPENNEFSTAENLETINTDGDDITPFYHTATNTLYFSNNSRQGLGGYDIFKSEKTGDEWSEPEHGGYPLNSSLDDIHYKQSPGGATAYFASNRLGSTYIEREKESCCHDIYAAQTELVDLLVTSFEKRSGAPLNGVKVTLTKLNRSGEPESKTNDAGNDFAFTPKRKFAYLITAEKEGYNSDYDTVYLDRSPWNDMLAVTSEVYLEPSEVTLTVLTFDDFTKTGLVGTKVQLFEVVNGERILVKELVNKNGNDFTFTLKPGKTYVIRGSKNGYEHDLKTITVPEAGDLKDVNIQEDLYLAPLIFAEYLPISLYFDNDEPDKNTKSVTTAKSYLETWDQYYGRKPTFIDEFGKGMTGQKKMMVTNRLEGFFEDQVKKSGDNLKLFSDLLYQFLKQGNNIELILKGYTSPRAESDYNEYLSKRRIVSVKNHFERYSGGIFKQYIDSGSLVIRQRAFGETQAKSDVSDKLDDVRNSIYGVPASLERRVEIIEVKQAENFQNGTR